MKNAVKEFLRQVKIKAEEDFRIERSKRPDKNKKKKEKDNGH